MKIITWNVNGVRSVANKGFLTWLTAESPDIVCLQETKAHPEQLTDDLLNPPGYLSYWASAVRRGYSGVALLVRDEPLEVHYGLGIHDYDSEGRVIIATYPNFTLLNVYVPNGQRDGGRLRYKLAFYEDLLAYCNRLRAEGCNVIICGDFNTAHREIDLANPKSNQKNSGFLPEERAWIERYIEHGYLDIFREFNQLPGQYTWWTYRLEARARNIGWRLDYFLTTTGVAVEGSYILADVLGSDHCPVALILADEWPSID